MTPVQKNTLTVNVRGRKTEALVDLGASVTIMSRGIFRKTIYSCHHLENPYFPSIRGANYSTMNLNVHMNYSYCNNIIKYRY